MSKKLGQLLAERAAARPSFVTCVEIEFQPVAMVTFYPWEAKEWAFPWARLDAFSFSDKEESERLELHFSNYHVTIVGENLRKILADIRKFKVSTMRDLPASHRATLTQNEVFIERLEVRPLTAPKGPALTGQSGSGSAAAA